MTTVTHSKVSAVADGGDATKVRPSDWNDDHVISGEGLTLSKVGYDTVGGSFTNMAGTYAKKITLSVSTLVMNIGTYVKGNSTNAGAIGVAIFSDSGGTPLNVVARTGPGYDFVDSNVIANNVLNSTGRWIDIPVNAFLTAGDYWICAIGGASGAGGMQIALDGSGTDKTQGSYYPFDNSASAFGSTTNKYSIRALIAVSGLDIARSGTAFPTGPATNDRFYRTDLGMEFSYDGTRWVSTQLFTGAPMSDHPLVAAATSDVFYGATPWDMYVVDLVTACYPTATNNGSHYWTLAVRKVTAGNTPTILGSHTTISDTTSQWNRHVVSVNVAVDVATYFVVDTIADKTGTPGDLYFGMHYTYRRIAT